MWPDNWIELLTFFVFGTLPLVWTVMSNECTFTARSNLIVQLAWKQQLRMDFFFCRMWFEIGEKLTWACVWVAFYFSYQFWKYFDWWKGFCVKNTQKNYQMLGTIGVFVRQSILDKPQANKATQIIDKRARSLSVCWKRVTVAACLISQNLFSVTDDLGIYGHYSDATLIAAPK